MQYLVLWGRHALAPILVPFNIVICQHECMLKKDASCSGWHNVHHTLLRFGFPSAGMVGKQGVAAPVNSRLVCQPCFVRQLLHHCVNASLLLLHCSE
jgi:hypothetical protein